jgi:hypothetical protein
MNPDYGMDQIIGYNIYIYIYIYELEDGSIICPLMILIGKELSYQSIQNDIIWEEYFHFNIIENDWISTRTGEG